MPEVHYEARRGVETLHPDDAHGDSDPFITCVWYAEERGVERKVKIPVNRVVRIVEEATDEPL
jgi:hypothetical protein